MLIMICVCHVVRYFAIIYVVPEDEVWNYVSVNALRNHGKLHDKLVLYAYILLCNYYNRYLATRRYISWTHEY